jgi:hypothetical protein
MIWVRLHRLSHRLRIPMDWLCLRNGAVIARLPPAARR